MYTIIQHCGDRDIHSCLTYTASSICSHSLASSSLLLSSLSLSLHAADSLSAAWPSIHGYYCCSILCITLLASHRSTTADHNSKLVLASRLRLLIWLSALYLRQQCAGHIVCCLRLFRRWRSVCHQWYQHMISELHCIDLHIIHLLCLLCCVFSRQQYNELDADYEQFGLSICWI